MPNPGQNEVCERQIDARCGTSRQRVTILRPEILNSTTEPFRAPKRRCLALKKV